MRLGRTDSRLRMVAVMLVFTIVAAAAGVRLGYWQVVAAEGLTAQVEAVAEQNRAAATKTIRADIVDRTGQVLAKTSFFDSVVAYPNLVDEATQARNVDLLAALLDLDEREQARYRDALSQATEQGKEWVRLAPRLELAESERVRDAMEQELLPGIDLEVRDVRYYPRKGGEPGTSLASHILGFVRADGEGGEGVERYYDDRLTTVQPGLIDLAAVDGGTVRFEDVDPPALELTLDAKLQRQLEKEISLAKTANKAKSVSALVMDPATGAILAAASVPAYHAEGYAELAASGPKGMGALKNRVFQDTYEPGSVMKIFTATAALDLGRVTPSTPIKDQRVLRFWKYKVRNADHDVKNGLTVTTAIAYSRNVATAKIARKLAPNTQKAAHRLYDLWKKVGITGRTGVDISYEAEGTFYDPDEHVWAPVDLANKAFGQGLAVTLPQLARGISTIVNGGYLVQPHLAADGEQATVEPKRVLTAKTARQAKEILRYVTGGVPWYAQGSLIAGYDVGGKTGTAQIWDTAKNQFKKRRFNHSFIGFVAGRDQEYVIAVRIEEPVPLQVSQGRLPLEIESYELFQMLALDTIKQLGIRKSKDPNAGRPIVGSEAARELDPARNRQAVKARQEARRSERSATQVAKPAAGGERGRRGRGLDVAADPPADPSAPS